MVSRYDRFTSLIMRINKSIQKIKCNEMAELGLKGNQVQCLFHLYQERDGLSATKLCELCEEDKAAISRTIKNLENGGFVFMDDSGEKKYKNPIKLTAKGREVGEYISNKIECLLAGAGIDEKERDKFYEMLEIVCANLQKVCDKQD